MPILHTRPEIPRDYVSAASTRQSSVETLQLQGPCVEAFIGVASIIERQWRQEDLSIPPPIKGYALIDTGASSTCVDDSVARRLGLPVVDVVHISSASHPSTLQNVYPVQLMIEGFPVSIEVPMAIGTMLASQGIIALIGRDLLRHCTLF